MSFLKVIEMSKRLFLFDGTAILYRAYFAIDVSLSNSRGEPTNAIFGLARMLSKFAKDFMQAGDHALFAFDREEPTHRHEMYEQYKATRKPMPDALVGQLKYVPDLVEGYGIRFISIPTLEADDIIATASKKFHDVFDRIFVVSGDKDLLQLIDDKVQVLRFVTGLTDLEEYDKSRVSEKFGLPTEKLFDFFALSGDSSDNVPGVPGVGPKTARKLLKEYGSVEEIYKNIRELAPGLRKKLIDGKKSLDMSSNLVKLVTDAKLDLDTDATAYMGIRKERLRRLFMEMEFSSLMKEMDLYENSVEDDSEEVPYTLIGSNEQLDKVLHKLKNASKVSFDVETNSLDPVQARIVGMSFCTGSGESFYVPINHTAEAWQASEKRFLKEIGAILASPGNKLVGQNLKFDYAVLESHKIQPATPYFDTMIAAYLLNPDSRRFNLDDLAAKFLGYRTTSFKELMEKSQLSADFSEVPIQEAAKYSCEDAVIALKLEEILSKKLYESNLENVFYELEMKLIPVLVTLELNGVYFDIKRLGTLSNELERELDRTLDELFKAAGESFNPNSPSQVGKVLFDRLGLSPPRKTKQGSYSTSADVLEDLVSKHPAVQKLLEYRKLQKLKSTYIDALPNLVNPATGRIHTNYHQTGTGTGRLSSSNPNMQNLPIREKEGQEIRKCIIPERESWKILSADYSQIELRLLADFSGDERLIDAFERNEDIHALTASQLYGIPGSDVNDNYRRVGKMVNFSIVYGISAYGLARRLKESTSNAQKMITNYFSAYPGVRSFIMNTIKEAKEKGFVRTLFGRRREVPQFRTMNRNAIQEGERIAINTPLQGTAADIIKFAMIKIHERMKSEKMKSMMTIQVHDELVFETPEGEAEKLRSIVKEEMEQAAKLKVPLVVDVAIDDYWS